MEKIPKKFCIYCGTKECETKRHTQVGNQGELGSSSSFAVQKPLNVSARDKYIYYQERDI